MKEDDSKDVLSKNARSSKWANNQHTRSTILQLSEITSFLALPLQDTTTKNKAVEKEKHREAFHFPCVVVNERKRGVFSSAFSCI